MIILNAPRPLVTFLFFFLSISTFYHVFAQPIDAWKAIFNGQNFDGWAVIERPANATVKDSSMVLHMTAYTSRHAFVRTDKKFKDFIFEVDFKRDRAIDSGILFRSESTPDTAFSQLFGYMVKVDPQPARLWTGGIFLDFGNGINWLYTLADDDRARNAEKESGEWNRLRIEAIGMRIRVWLNGIPTCHLIDDKYREGFIAFKIHYLKDEIEKEKLAIAYKNMRIITRNPEKYERSIDLPPIDSRKKVDIKYFR